jgi:hypothetical protein
MPQYVWPSVSQAATKVSSGLRSHLEAQVGKNLLPNSLKLLAELIFIIRVVTSSIRAISVGKGHEAEWYRG